MTVAESGAIRVPSLLAIQGERARRSFKYFFREFAWPVLYPGVSFVDGWHVDAVCEHLEAVKRRQIKKLYINLPGRHLKSTLVTQSFPAWDWIDDPQLTYLTASYAQHLATRDSAMSRLVMQSQRYQDAFGRSFQLRSDQNEKHHYANSRGGYRLAVGVDTGVTGFGGNRRIVDDPVNPADMNSAVKIARGVEWWKGTFSTRVNDPKNDTIVLAQQRLSADDTTGYVTTKEDGWVGLVIPLRHEVDQPRRTTSLGWTDPRTVDRALMQPERIGEAEAAPLERQLGEYHRLAQLQQRPKHRGGVIFKRSDYRFWTVLPVIDYWLMSVDCTFKDGQTNDHVAVQAWGLSGPRKILVKRIKERMSFSATCMAVRTMHASLPDCMAVLIEDKANGSAVIETLSKEVAGVIAINPDGGKAARAYAMQPDHEAGNVWLPDPTVDPDIETFLVASSAFTGADGGDDDEIDGMTQAVNWSRKRFGMMGLQEHMRAQAEAMAQQIESAKRAREALMSGVVGRP